MREEPGQALAIVVALVADEDCDELDAEQVTRLVWWWYAHGSASRNC